MPPPAECAAGFQGPDCLPCPPGTVKPPGPGGCTACPSGQQVRRMQGARLLPRQLAATPRLHAASPTPCMRTPCACMQRRSRLVTALTPTPMRGHAHCSRTPTTAAACPTPALGASAAPLPCQAVSPAARRLASLMRHRPWCVLLHLWRALTPWQQHARGCMHGPGAFQQGCAAASSRGSPMRSSSTAAALAAATPGGGRTTPEPGGPPQPPAGETQVCGTCTFPDTCGLDGQCENSGASCVPKQACDPGFECGFADDGCEC